MTAFSGRDILIKIGGIGTAAATLADQDKPQSVSVTRSRGEVDITDGEANGWRTLLVKPGTKSVDLSISGVMVEDEYNKLLQRYYDDANTAHYSLEINHPADSGGTGTDQKEVGKFFLQSLETTGEHAGAVTFSATFLSSGAVALQNQ